MSGAGWVALTIIGVQIGRAAAAASGCGRVTPREWAGGAIAGLAGAYLGGAWLGQWGWVIGGLNVFGAIIGASLTGSAVAVLARAAPAMHSSWSNPVGSRRPRAGDTERASPERADFRRVRQ